LSGLDLGVALGQERVARQPHGHGLQLTQAQGLVFEMVFVLT
jgi:hypothetical protein